MIPAKGGEPLPPSPVCLPRDYEKASLYLHEIIKALDRPGWSKRQRVILRDLFRKWAMRAEGRDEHFEVWGTFPPRPGGEPPTVQDQILATWKKLSRLSRSPEERQQERDARARSRRRSQTPDDPRFRSRTRTRELKEEQDTREES